MRSSGYPFFLLALLPLHDLTLVAALQACLAAGLAGTRETRSSRKAAAAAVRAGADETAGAPASLTRLSEHGSVSTAQ
jgi:hypothetical protein